MSFSELCAKAAKAAMDVVANDCRRYAEDLGDFVVGVAMAVDKQH